ncbi:DinB family protein [uncultured Maribacter sp.]|uniref:DinB family protein n=1 Tax=uncultured Maribacter sp. TaxID=431308 RepID=UPI0026266A57|nr:DinB family protein [uncultured Maribacter sp.]
MKKSELKPIEYKEFYATYLNAIGDVNLFTELVDGKNWMIQFINSLDESKLGYSYGEGKWTIAEVIMHIIDTERVFQYRAFSFSKNDQSALPGFDQDEYMANTDVSNRTKESILEEYLSVREASISLYKNLQNKQLNYIGTASGIRWSVAGIGFVISGHQKHHCTILQERYS